MLSCVKQIVNSSALRSMLVFSGAQLHGEGSEGLLVCNMAEE